MTKLQPSMPPTKSLLVALAMIIGATIAITVIAGPGAVSTLPLIIGALVGLVKVWPREEAPLARDHVI